MKQERKMSPMEAMHRINMAALDYEYRTGRRPDAAVLPERLYEEIEEYARGMIYVEDRVNGCEVTLLGMKVRPNPRAGSAEIILGDVYELKSTEEKRREGEA